MKNKKELHNDKYILDACCGSRMFWFDKSNKNTVFMDNRVLEDTLDVLGDKLITKSDISVNELMAIIQQCIELGLLEEETCTNESEYDSTEEFRCSNCGFTLVEHKEYAIGEDDGEEYYFNFKPKYCPNCGSKIID